MEKASDRETRDFMSVESFSQLPFIRPTPPQKGTGAGVGAGAGAGAIRLFGKDFGTNTDEDQTDPDARKMETNKGSSDGTEPGNRKFECYYCCRNFPTSQALGGHQNAHKRERQQAKRAHLQSTMLHGTFADRNVYGYMNYGRLATAPPLPLAYHSWAPAAGDSYTAASSRIYGGYGSFAAHPQAINGSPFAYWRAPAAQNSPAFARDRHAPLPAFKPSSSSQLRFGYESKPEHVSLDLHL